MWVEEHSNIYFDGLHDVNFFHVFKQISLSNKNRIDYRSVISGNSRNDKHEIKCDYEFDHKRLQVRTSGECSCEMVLLAIEYKSESSTS